MVIGAALVTLHMPACRSLKDKRQIVKSLIAQTQNQFRVSAAEVDRHDQWQVGVIGLACVSNDARHVDEVLARAVDFLAGRKIGAELLEYETEVIHVF